MLRTTVSAMAVCGAVAACGSSGSTSTAPTPGIGTSTTPGQSQSQAPIPVESNPPGDIPDNLAFVRYTNRPGHYSFVHPEGWAQSTRGSSVTFTDKLSGVSAAVVNAAKPPTVSSVKSSDIPRLQHSQAAFSLSSVQSVSLPAGTAVMITFRRNSAPNSVTGQTYRDEVQEYLIWKNGHELRFDLFGVVGADNVDAYRTMSRSVQLS